MMDSEKTSPPQVRAIQPFFYKFAFSSRARKDLLDRKDHKDKKDRKECREHVMTWYGKI